ncbi:N-6 DNA methylase [Pseudoalteromonas sp. 120-MNA-CIBAN-0494]|uniref:Eco57I restriction-modification methylase domain-containing protein n=1 Tax=unclassified Pseudoalteromonas TaxID=194690 RepID=UPI00331C6295
MRKPLEKTLRSKLEKAVEKARDIVEVAVTEALIRLGISNGSAPTYLSEAERKLRNRLRAHGRQLGDVLNKESGKQEKELLVDEMAYEHWHRMLFARFLEQSDLLMYDLNTHVTLAECFELAEEEPGIKDGWELAGQLAQKMLPQIFRADSPVFEVKLSINHINDLEELVATLDKETFQASDALGWCYQFWQNKKKKQVNESGVKIGAKELSPVTQLFTEPYMVSFLLDNALGAWWAKRRLTQDDLATATSEQELRELASIPGVPLEYLRFVQDETTKTWSCAAGDFEKWPDDLSEFKTLDPCCGSGHFLVAKFLMLVPIRMELEGLTAKEAIDKVLEQNIHGLELDQRCVELAAFALALEAWRFPNTGGYRKLPTLNVACVSQTSQLLKKLTIKNENISRSLINLIDSSSLLGSLSKPEEVEPLIDFNDLALKVDKEDESEYRAFAEGINKAFNILLKRFDFVATNVPYRTRNTLNSELISYIDKNYPKSKNELANVFLERCLDLTSSYGYTQVVMPQNWLYLKGYINQREELLRNSTWLSLARLGTGAFETISGEVVNVILLTLQKSKPTSYKKVSVIDANDGKGILQKANLLAEGILSEANQLSYYNNPDHIISIGNIDFNETLNSYSGCFQGLSSGDNPRFILNFSEVNNFEKYEMFQSTSNETNHFGGKEFIVSNKVTSGAITLGALRGKDAWGKKGVGIARVSSLNSCLYGGQYYANTCPVVIPENEPDLAAIWCYISSEEFKVTAKSLNQSLSIDNGYLGKIPFEKKKWKGVALEKYPFGLPKPYSNDLTQWIFHGHPCASVVWGEETKTTSISKLREDDTVLQVAVARLLGYRWPAELDTDMELAPEMREIITQNKVFDDLVDDDGIVCIPAIRGEKPAVDRLEAILHAAYGDKWSATVLNNLLKSVKSRDLNIWLRDKFFEQHCKLFQHRPFIWHIWDGLPDGFSALVNYHQLDYKGLERLIYTYLDDWISIQIQLEKDGDEGAEIRLAAARNLRKQLEDILVGEKGLDIFVRWKSLAEQPIGWNPDLNDGVRLNIRPFMKAKDIGKKDAGILRSKPNIHWKKDRGTDVASAPWYDLGLEYGGKQGDRINDHHLTLAEKKSARDKV